MIFFAETIDKRGKIGYTIIEVYKSSPKQERKEDGIMMEEIQLAPVEEQFVNLVWDHQPVSSTRLVALAAEALEWKKSTTYTVLKRLCERGVLENENATVSARITRREYLASKSNRFVAEHFAGSIPMFLASFQEKASLSEEDWELLRRMIARHEEEK